MAQSSAVKRYVVFGVIGALLVGLTVAAIYGARTRFGAVDGASSGVATSNETETSQPQERPSQTGQSDEPQPDAADQEDVASEDADSAVGSENDAASPAPSALGSQNEKTPLPASGSEDTLWSLVVLGVLAAAVTVYVRSQRFAQQR